MVPEKKDCCMLELLANITPHSFSAAMRAILTFFPGNCFMKNNSSHCVLLACWTCGLPTVKPIPSLLRHLIFGSPEVPDKSCFTSHNSEAVQEEHEKRHGRRFCQSGLSKPSCGVSIKSSTVIIGSMVQTSSFFGGKERRWALLLLPLGPRTWKESGDYGWPWIQKNPGCFLQNLHFHPEKISLLRGGKNCQHPNAVNLGHVSHFQRFLSYLIVQLEREYILSTFKSFFHARMVK